MIYNQIDFVICRQREARRLVDAQSRVWTDIQSDHRLLCAYFESKGEHWQKRGKKEEERKENEPAGRLPEYEREPLANKEVRAEWRRRIDEKLGEWERNGGERNWQRLKAVMAEVVQELFPRKKARKWQVRRFRENIRIERLSKAQKRMRERVETAPTPEQAQQWRVKRRRVLSELKSECGKQARAWIEEEVSSVFS
jgi:hypothetical protein